MTFIYKVLYNIGMANPLLPVPAPVAWLYERWYGHFLENRDGPFTLPWHDRYRLSAAERSRKLFIAEEQAHSGILGRFLDGEEIPRLERHWLDAVFRRLRKLADLEVCVMVLVTAEVLAIPFYQALRDATRSQLLRAICWRILCDEAAHLNYQTLTLGLVRRSLSERACRIRSFCHHRLFQGAAVLVWQQHRRVFRAAGWGFRLFWSESRREFTHLERLIRQASFGGECDGSIGELRLSD